MRQTDNQNTTQLGQKRVNELQGEDHLNIACKRKEQTQRKKNGTIVGDIQNRGVLAPSQLKRKPAFPTPDPGLASNSPENCVQDPSRLAGRRAPTHADGRGLAAPLAFNSGERQT